MSAIDYFQLDELVRIVNPVEKPLNLQLGRDFYAVFDQVAVSEVFDLPVLAFRRIDDKIRIAFISREHIGLVQKAVVLVRVFDSTGFAMTAKVSDDPGGRNHLFSANSRTIHQIIP